MEALDSVTLIVKAPNLRIEDKRVACDRTWTVRKLKEHLSTVYPEQPHEDQQKLVYFGKLLNDEASLHEVLTQESYDDAHTVHLVCPAKSMPSSTYKPRFSTLNRNQQIPEQSSEVRRRVVTAPASSQPSESSGQQPLPTVPTALEQAQHWSNYSTQYLQYLQMQSSMSANMTPQQRLYLQLMQQQAAIFNLQMQQSISASQMNDGSASVAGVEQQRAEVAEEPVGVEPAAEDDVVQMNAQGGVDADVGQNDWLDYTYAFVRFGMLMMLLYFYTTFTRFAVVILVGLFFYLARNNFFALQRRRPGVRPAQQHPQQNEQNPAAENQNNENNERDNVVNPNPAEHGEQNNNVPNEQQTSWVDAVKIVITFVVTFFSSLIPQNPAAMPN